MRKSFVFFVILALQTSLGHASLLEKIYGDFSKMNLTPPRSYKDQQAGYMTGGGLVVRSPNAQVNPFNVSLPSISSGCGGVDAFFGSISFISHKSLLDMLNRIGGAAPSYAFQLALKTLSPEVEGALSELRNIMMKMNALELESCQMGMNLVGGVLPKGSEAHKKHCQFLHERSNQDSFGARQDCQNPDEVVRAVEETKTDERNKHLLQGEYNLTWRIAQDLHFDDETTLFAMSALGTIISEKVGNEFKVTSYRGFGSEEDFLEGHVKGGASVDRYVCLGASCENIKKIEHTISVNASYQEYFRKWIDRMCESYRTNSMKGELAEQTIALLIDASALPLMRYIEISQATGAMGILDDALEYMTRQILIRRIERIGQEIKTALNSMAKIQLEDSVIEEFKDQIEKITDTLKAQARGYRRDAITRLEQEIKAHEVNIKATKGF